MWVLDTNTLIYFFKGQGRVSDVLLSDSPGHIGITAVVLYELEVGIAKSTSPRKRLEQLKTLTAVTQLLPLRSRSGSRRSYPRQPGKAGHTHRAV